MWPEEDQDIVDLASYLLWAATGKVYGPCPVSVLPCNELTCGYCHHPLRQCGCRSVPEIRLDGPVHSVTEVVIDGIALPDTSYRIDDYEWLVRLDGESWPTNADPLDPDSFRVDYLLGFAPPGGAATVTGALACEIAKDRCGNANCRLPSNLRTVSRQGITVGVGRNVFVNPFQKFGVPSIDLWVEMVASPVLAGAVHSPDFPHIRKITWEASTSPGSP